MSALQQRFCTAAVAREAESGIARPGRARSLKLDFIGSPVRVGISAWMRRSYTAEAAAVQILEVMARTPGDGGWCGVKEFGLRDYMMTIETRRGLQREAIQAVNRVLADLDIKWFRVDAIEKEEGSDPSVAFYRVSVFFTGKGTEVLKVKM